jgi:hypothetical protein
MLNWFPGFAPVQCIRRKFGEAHSLLTDDASNMSTMAIAIIVRVIVWNRSVATVVSVANKVMTIGDLATRTEAPTKARMMVVDAAVDDADVDAPASDTLLVEFVYSSHNVDGLSISSASRKGGVVGTTKDDAFLCDRAWNEGDGSNSDNTVGVGQMDEVLIALERKRGTNEEIGIVVFLSDIPVNATPGKIFVEIGVGLGRSQ